MEKFWIHRFTFYWDFGSFLGEQNRNCTMQNQYCVSISQSLEMKFTLLAYSQDFNFHTSLFLYNFILAVERWLLQADMKENDSFNLTSFVRLALQHGGDADLILSDDYPKEISQT